MNCFNLVLNGQDSCFSELTGRYQQIVFIRKTDVEIYDIDSSLDTTTYPSLNPIANHSIAFKLKDNSKGYRFQLSENSSVINGTFSKSDDNSIPRYTHSVSIGIHGVSEQKRWILKQFDLSKDYFAVLQHKSDLIEVFGFHHGFNSSSYEYDNNATIDLTSSFDEYDIPYIYRSEISGNEIIDFDNDFSQIEKDLNDFNNDFNNDYNN